MSAQAQQSTTLPMQMYTFEVDIDMADGPHVHYFRTCTDSITAQMEAFRAGGFDARVVVKTVGAAS